MPTGVYERVKIVTKETRIKQSKSTKKYISSLTVLGRRERCEAFQKAGTKAGQTLGGRIKSSNAQKNWWINIASEEEKAKRILYLLEGTLKRWVQTDKKERSKQMTPCFKAGNKATREKCAKETKQERLERLKPWIEAGQKASQEANPSSIERMIWEIFDELGIKYETQKKIGYWVVDIYIPTWKLIIECNGSYWHNYEIFPEKEVRDRAVNKYANKNDYKIIWLWESNIRRNPKQALIDELKKLNLRR